MRFVSQFVNYAIRITPGRKQMTEYGVDRGRGADRRGLQRQRLEPARLRDGDPVFKFRGIHQYEDEATPVSPAYRLSVFDTDERGRARGLGRGDEDAGGEAHARLPRQRARLRARRRACARPAVALLRPVRREARGAGRAGADARATTRRWSSPTRRPSGGSSARTWSPRSRLRSRLAIPARSSSPSHELSGVKPRWAKPVIPLGVEEVGKAWSTGGGAGTSPVHP